MESRVGEVFENKRGEKAEIIEYTSSRKAIIKFEDGTIRSNIRYGDLKRGNFGNKNIPHYYSVGYSGYGCFNVGKDKLACDKWVRMLDRCYNNQNYKDVTVCEEWHNFQNFAQWFYENYDPEHMKGWHLDKDILVKGNKIYSPETCCFVPVEINNLFTNMKNSSNNLPIGVLSKHGTFQAGMRKRGRTFHIGTFNTLQEAFKAYKLEKEKFVKEVADEWRGLISAKVYEALYNYKIEITDNYEQQLIP